jgi:molecular chaperone HscB
MAECWSCGAERGDAPLCATCGKVQPPTPSTTYFALFGIPRAMRIAIPELERAFREVSKKVHPDRFGTATPVERRLALEQTTLVNEAYRTLKDPKKRAEYLMRLEGIDIAKEESRTPDLSLLGEMMELQEEIDRTDSPEALEVLRKQIADREGDVLVRVERYFDEALGSREQCVAALHELRYLRRLIDLIDTELEEAAGG